jgi:hypothetical protein
MICSNDLQMTRTVGSSMTAFSASISPMAHNGNTRLKMLQATAVYRC